MNDIFAGTGDTEHPSPSSPEPVQAPEPEVDSLTERLAEPLPCLENDPATTAQHSPLWYIVPLLGVFLSQFASLILHPAPVGHRTGPSFGTSEHDRNEYAARLDLAHSGTPNYPQWMIDRNIQDHVSLTCTIDALGHSHDCKVTRGHFPELNHVVLAYAARATYFPATKNGFPVRSRYRLNINFSIK